MTGQRNDTSRDNDKEDQKLEESERVLETKTPRNV
jgi:hypothetical protein